MLGADFVRGWSVSPAPLPTLAAARRRCRLDFLQAAARHAVASSRHGPLRYERAQQAAAQQAPQPPGGGLQLSAAQKPVPSASRTPHPSIRRKIRPCVRARARQVTRRGRAHESHLVSLSGARRRARAPARKVALPVSGDAGAAHAAPLAGVEAADRC